MSTDLIGKTAVVYQDIPSGEAGKVTVRMRGTDEQLFARAPIGESILTGTKVLITDLLNSSTVTVQPL